MNELIFLLQIVWVAVFTLGALKLGKNALISIIAIQGILANLFVLKQINLFGLDVTCSDVFVVGGVLGLNLLQEYYGQEIVKKTIWISFGCVVFYLLTSQLHLMYSPNLYDNMNVHYYAILHFMPRITLASIFVYLITQRLSCLLYAFLKKIFNNQYLVARNIFSNFCVQFLDTILFAFLGLYGIVGSIFHVILMSLIIKTTIIFIASPFVSFSKKIIKKDNQHE